MNERKVELSVRPHCRGIEPEFDNGGTGYYCQRCGFSLIGTRSGWYRHGQEWRHPEVWTRHA